MIVQALLQAKSANQSQGFSVALCFAVLKITLLRCAFHSSVTLTTDAHGKNALHWAISRFQRISQSAREQYKHQQQQQQQQSQSIFSDTISHIQYELQTVIEMLSNYISQHSPAVPSQWLLIDTSGAANNSNNSSSMSMTDYDSPMHSGISLPYTFENGFVDSNNSYNNNNNIQPQTHQQYDMTTVQKLGQLQAKVKNMRTLDDIDDIQNLLEDLKL